MMTIIGASGNMSNNGLYGSAACADTFPFPLFSLEFGFLLYVPSRRIPKKGEAGIYVGERANFTLFMFIHFTPFFWEKSVKVLSL